MDDSSRFTYEDAIDQLDELSSSDESDFSDAKSDEFTMEPGGSTFLRMYEDSTNYRDGATKTTYQGSQTGQTIYEDEQSGCSVSVDRLVWVDGWRGQPEKDGRDEAMTLVVLKLGLHPEEFDARVLYASLQLQLKAGARDGKDPRLVAWGPFRRPEMWNVTDTKKRTSVTPSVQLSGGAAGQGVTAGFSGTKEVEWNTSHSDYGLSSPKGDTKNSKKLNVTDSEDRAPNAVLWQVFENKLVKRGVTPEIRVAALFTRLEPSDSSYRAVIKIEAHTSGAGQTAQRVLRRLGYHGSDSIKWTLVARPLDKGRCYAEGVDIVKDLDPANLGQLVDRKDGTELNPQWLNRWDRVETSQPAISMYTTAAAHPMAAAVAVAAKTHPATDDDVQEQRAAGQSAAQGDKRPAPSALVITSDDLECRSESTGSARAPGAETGVNKDITTGSEGCVDNVQYGHTDKIERLVDLETRAARAENRIAKQDQRILELEQTLTRVAQALLVPSLNARRG
ncbi:hypothetical protein MY1884_001992 [Beauveria asiatica]